MTCQSNDNASQGPHLRSQDSANLFIHVPWNVENGSPPQLSSTEDAVSATTTQLEPSRSRAPTARPQLFFFIPGNPGLANYYKPFMERLAISSSRTSGSATDTILVAMSLGGFEIDEDGSSNAETGHLSHKEVEEMLLYPPESHALKGGKNVFSLRGQIELAYLRLEQLCGILRKDWRSPGQKLQDDDAEIEVVLAGHSVGTYICLELVQLWHERRTTRLKIDHPSPSCEPAVSSRASNVPLSISASEKHSDTRPSWKPSTCILLTPTIQDLHLSPSGILATPLVTNLTFLPSLTQYFSRNILHRLLPASWLSSLVSRVTGMAANSHGLKTTLAFLRSKKGIEQALYMAECELNEIREDKWGEEVWGVAQTETKLDKDQLREPSSPRLFFWFAKEDHWVAQVTKEAILRTRAAHVVVARDHVAMPSDPAKLDSLHDCPEDAARQTSWPNINVWESEGLVHAWCLDQSKAVATRVGQWLES
jgi:CRISPR/Cas system CMR-associated protein Cmr5 small subunit